MKNLISILIILVVAFFTGNLAARILNTSKSYKANNLENLETLFYGSQSCTPTASAGSDKKIILRLDDVQRGYMNKLSQQMIIDAKARNMKLVLGVIPKGILEDSELVHTIKKNACNLEIAQHGWEHSYKGDPNLPEFGLISNKEAKKRIALGLKNLRKITNEELITFIPPQNDVTDEIKKDLYDAGFKIISSGERGEFDYDQSTILEDFNTLESVDKIMEGCNAAFQQDGKCIIMLHPQDYATNDKFDKDKYQNYLLLLKRIQQENISTVTFRDLQN